MSDFIKEILAKPVLTEADYKILADFEPNDGTNRLYSYFTPIWLCELMYKLAVRHGFNAKTGKVLEPAAGKGNFLQVLPYPKNVTAFELDPLNFAIAKLLSPGVTIYNNYFETAFLQGPRYTSLLKNDNTWLSDAPFDLVIGNPPYGKYANLYSVYFKNLKFKQVEMFFMLQSLKLLKKGGLMVFIIGSNFLRNENTYLFEKQIMSKYADIIDAYRMPKVFKNTDVPTDIVIFRRK